MKVIIESPFNMGTEQRNGLKDQVADLEKYNMGITQAFIYFKKDDGTTPDAITAEIELHVPGPIIFASDSNPDLTTAFSNALNKAERQLRKEKDIKTDHYN